ncbi:carbohydrate kinase family protein [Vallitalea okinawensis]|uniref:carbohydrate kinase family protein n=1 Tax=Vallitalea okinawensis TaxID=2078660 RepID=UPI000CFDF97B|nr:carbohydrate kinase family protein [Vallitalea okinawensis]
MDTKYDVLVVGDINPDIMMIDYDRLPNPGEETHSKDAHIALGGGCAICASGLAKLGMSVAVYGFLGSDMFGEMMVRKLEKTGVHTEHITIRNDINTGFSVALTNSEDRAFITYNGTNELFDVKDVPDEVIKSAGHVHALCYTPDKHGDYVEFFKRVKELGRTVSFDIGYDDTEQWSDKIMEIVELVDIFMPNEKEATNYTRKDTADAALKALATSGNTVIVKKGKDGSIAYRDGLFAEAGPFVTTCVDTTGAGDSFNAGFILGWLRGFDLGKCLIIGNAVGSKSVEQYGGSSGVPSYEELKAFLNKENISI